MGLWLLKTEPSTYSFAQLQQGKRTVWDGVKNALALKNLRQMQRGDRVFIYHTGDEKAVVGIAQVLGNAYPDPKAGNAKLLVVDIGADSPLPRPVTLAEMKVDPAFHGWDLLRLPRLSVLAVSAAHWARIEHLAKQR